MINDEDEVVDFHRGDGPGWDVAQMTTVAAAHRRSQEGRASDGFRDERTLRGSRGRTHKVQNLPVGVPALFLFNGHDIIIDATYGSEQALLGILAQWSRDRQRIIHR